MSLLKMTRINDPLPLELGQVVVPLNTRKSPIPTKVWVTNDILLNKATGKMETRRLGYESGGLLNGIQDIKMFEALFIKAGREFMEDWEPKKVLKRLDCSENDPASVVVGAFLEHLSERSDILDGHTDDLTPGDFRTLAERQGLMELVRELFGPLPCFREGRSSYHDDDDDGQEGEEEGQTSEEPAARVGFKTAKRLELEARKVWVEEDGEEDDEVPKPMKKAAEKAPYQYQLLGLTPDFTWKLQNYRNDEETTGRVKSMPIGEAGVADFCTEEFVFVLKRQIDPRSRAISASSVVWCKGELSPKERQIQQVYEKTKMWNHISLRNVATALARAWSHRTEQSAKVNRESSSEVRRNERYQVLAVLADGQVRGSLASVSAEIADDRTFLPGEVALVFRKLVGLAGQHQTTVKKNPACSLTQHAVQVCEALEGLHPWEGGQVLSLAESIRRAKPLLAESSREPVNYQLLSIKENRNPHMLTYPLSLGPQAYMMGREGEGVFLRKVDAQGRVTRDGTALMRRLPGSAAATMEAFRAVEHLEVWSAAAAQAAFARVGLLFTGVDPEDEMEY